ncbi:MBL fold metallo-hydrolase [Portibacter marinus]|uniref:MBL fold metallo-hydrolase n=1 Tax=Portibacter marinus TaxID=2898660 RepID=UPI001F44708E|nr:MBL fold metallo-hydrolase [Portibacter marinus]
MKKRDFLKNCLLTTAPLAIGVLNKLPLEMLNSDIHKLTIGNANCTIYKDLLFNYKATDYFINAEPNELESYLTKYNINPDQINSPFIAMLIELDDRKILIDTGSGYSNTPISFRGRTFPLKGQLLSLLSQSEVDNESITDVIITHFHPDHIGGIYSDGKLNYPNAKFHVHQKEWDYWNTNKSINENPLFQLFVEKNIKPLSNENLSFVKQDEYEIIPGITSIIASGHTPGQIAILIKSGDESILYTSDSFLHPIHIEKLNWRTNYDNDHKKARSTREKLLNISITENALINSFHFDFPGLGIAEQNESNWKWISKA